MNNREELAGTDQTAEFYETLGSADTDSLQDNPESQDSENISFSQETKSSDVSENSIDEYEGCPVNMELLEAIIDAIRPSLQADGGDCTLIGVEPDGTVMIEFMGACIGCPLATVTMSMGIERILKEHVPGVTSVQSI